MKKKLRDYLYNRWRQIVWEKESPPVLPNTLDCWPDLKLCVKLHYKTHPGMQRYHSTIKQPIKFKFTEKFMKSLNKYCTTNALRSQFIDSLTKVVYKIPCAGLYDKSIKERSNLWHFYVSLSWRVFYRKGKNHIVLEEFCPHKKLLYHRR